MSTADKENENKIRGARRLCELFRGRFSEQVAKELIQDLGGELEVADFLLNEDRDVVSSHLKKSTSYLDELRSDSQKVSTQLEKGIEYEVRQFACGNCDRSWWKKVPLRKQVGKCCRCHMKFDPVPHDREWGWAKFICSCSNEFNAFGEMGVTKSECYKCHFMVPIDSVLPPRKRIGQRKSNNTHSCDAPNCHNRSTGPTMPVFNMTSIGSTHMSHGNNITYNVGAANPEPGAWNVHTNKKAVKSGAPGVCMHPNSARTGRRIRTASNKHISTGSTVATFLTQGSLETKSIATMPSILED